MKGYGEEKMADDNGAVLPTVAVDAGLKDLNHYANKLPRWRYAVRQSLIPCVRWETLYLSRLQASMRTPALDSYFAFTANLGTHSFFMIMLPVFFWCGYSSVGRALVHVLAAGVFWSGFVKDLLCLPRPLSPPLQRITMSGSAVLEYGFPSTHSTNAVSVVVYAIVSLNAVKDSTHPIMILALQALLYLYAASIIFGRLYCGMHGFLDVIVGALLGAGIAVMQLAYGGAFNVWISEGSYVRPLIATLVSLVLVRIHPEPADDCPCFDDSVSFTGVFIGIEIGVRHFAGSRFASDYPVPGTVPFNLAEIGLLKACARIFLGVFTVFAWRGITKPIMLKSLPPLFRLLEKVRMNLPRKFFLRASQYGTVPPLRKDDNVIPDASDIPRLLETLRHPRKRSVSIGPQSIADAYEAIAYRRNRRENSHSPSSEQRQALPLRQQQKVCHGFSSGSKANGTFPIPNIMSSGQQIPTLAAENGDVVIAPDSAPSFEPEDVLDMGEDEEPDEQAILLKLQKPRVRYDVEVVTKLFVYSGIGWLAAEGNPILFNYCGLGMMP